MVEWHDRTIAVVQERDANGQHQDEGVKQSREESSWYLVQAILLDIRQLWGQTRLTKGHGSCQTASQAQAATTAVVC